MNDLEQETRVQPEPVRIFIRIPSKLHSEPVISQLSRHVDVNILAAVLGSNAQGDGWFDLQLKGSPQQINSALVYLAEMNIEVLNSLHSEQDGW